MREDVGGTDFFFSPAEGRTWHLAGETFEEAVLKRWPGTVFHASPGRFGRVHVTFQAPEDGGVYDGSYTPSDESLTLRMLRPGEAADFLLWFLHLIPAEAGVRFNSEMGVESDHREDFWLPVRRNHADITAALTEHMVLAESSF